MITKLHGTTKRYLYIVVLRALKFGLGGRVWG